MKRVILPVVLGLVGTTIFLTSVALAAPNHPAALPAAVDTFQLDDPISDTNTISDTGTISHTTSVSHPVASAIAEYFEVNASEIATLHDEGLGFGVIAHAYFVARTLGDITITPADVLDQFQSGKGWGEILKDYGLHPGLAGRGGNLGSIMSGRDRTLPPGQLKKLSPDEADTFIPPGQLKKSNGDDSDDRGGPPSVPPGQNKDKGNKGKKS
jgi:hypothetical protein